jgi:hypothetical protein
MSINDFLDKIKPFYTLILLIVVSTIFFALGRLSALRTSDEPLRIVPPSADLTGNVISATATTTETSSNEVSATPIDQNGEVIGSKSGKKYYFPWCGTVKRIKPENQIHFASIEEAKKAGFTPGGNCKGLK